MENEGNAQATWHQNLDEENFRGMRGEKSPRGRELLVSDPALHVTGALFIDQIRRCDVR